MGIDNCTFGTRAVVCANRCRWLALPHHYAKDKVRIPKLYCRYRDAKRKMKEGQCIRRQRKSMDISVEDEARTEGQRKENGQTDGRDLRDGKTARRRSITV